MTATPESRAAPRSTQPAITSRAKTRATHIMTGVTGINVSTKTIRVHDLETIHGMCDRKTRIWRLSSTEWVGVLVLYLKPSPTTVNKSSSTGYFCLYSFLLSVFFLQFHLSLLPHVSLWFDHATKFFTLSLTGQNSTCSIQLPRQQLRIVCRQPALHAILAQDTTPEEYRILSYSFKHSYPWMLSLRLTIRQTQVLHICWRVVS